MCARTVDECRARALRLTSRPSAHMRVEHLSQQLSPLFPSEWFPFPLWCSAFSCLTGIRAGTRSGTRRALKASSVWAVGSPSPLLSSSWPVLWRRARVVCPGLKGTDDSLFTLLLCVSFYSDHELSPIGGCHALSS